MNLLKRDRSIVDIIFMITVFGVFMLSALFVVLFGAKIYKKTAHDMSVNFSSRTSLAYVTEKLHQHDHKNGIEIIEDASEPILKMSQFVNSDEYCTYLYEYDGYLKELTVRGDVDLVKSAGKNILKLNSFGVTRVSDSLYRFNIEDDEGNKTEFYVSLYSYSQGGEADE